MIEAPSEKDRSEMEEELKRRAAEKAKTDIFKHTFVDAENVDVDNDISNQQQEETSTEIMSRPPKDVFTFMNLNFDLPVAYYQSFGDFNIATQNQRDLIKDFMFSHWPIMRNKKLNFRIAFDKSK